MARGEKGEGKEVREMGEEQRREMEKLGRSHSTTVNPHEKKKSRGERKGTRDMERGAEEKMTDQRKRQGLPASSIHPHFLPPPFSCFLHLA